MPLKTRRDPSVNFNLRDRPPTAGERLLGLAGWLLALAYLGGLAWVYYYLMFGELAGPLRAWFNAWTIFDLEIDEFIKDAILIVLIYALPVVLLWPTIYMGFGFLGLYERIRGFGRKR